MIGILPVPFTQILWLIAYVHMAFYPMKVIQIDTAGKATVLEAVQASHKVQTGFVCAGPNDIVAVDGLSNDPVHKKFWTIEVNGDYEHVNSESPVKDSDQLVLKYASSRER